MITRLFFLLITAFCVVAASMSDDNAAAQVSSSPNVDIVVTHGSPAITDIVLSGPGTFATGSAGSLPALGQAYVGNLHAVTSFGAFDDNQNAAGSIGSYSLATSSGSCSGPDSGKFIISQTSTWPNITILNTNGVLTDPPGTAYSICVVATQAGVTNSPFAKHFTITAESQSISNIWLSNTTFAPNLPNALVGWVQVPVAPADPIFGGTISVDDTAHFQIIWDHSSNIYLATNGAISGGPYTIHITATIAGASYTQAFTISAGSGIGASSQTFLFSYGGDALDAANNAYGASNQASFGIPWFIRATSGSGSANQTLAAVTVEPYPAYPLGSATCAIGGGDAALFLINAATCVLSVGSSNLPSSRPITSMTYNGTGQIAVVLPNTFTSPVSGTGQKIYISGAINSITGDRTNVNGVMPVVAYTDPQHFSVAPPGGTIGTITPGNLGFLLTVTETQSGIVNSPFTTLVDVVAKDPTQGTASCSGWTAPTLMIPNTYYTYAGATISVTVNNVPNCDNAEAVKLDMTPDSDTGLASPQTYAIGSGAHSGTFSFTVPYMPSTNYMHYAIELFDTSTGVISDVAIITVLPTLPYVVPSASNTLAAPFTPSQTITACPSGCTYTDLPSALVGLSNSNLSNTLDNVKITLGQGTYLQCMLFGNASAFTAPTSDGVWHMPHHLWIAGAGGDFPHINREWVDTGGCLMAGQVSGDKGVIEWWGCNGAGSSGGGSYCTGYDYLWIDNIEVSDWTAGSGNDAAFFIPKGGTATLRNVSAHDGGDMTLETGNGVPFSINVDHSYMARSGSASGPKHVIYLGWGDGQSTFNLTNSHIEQASVGYTVKTRMSTNNISCNLININTDPVYQGTANVEFPELSGDTLYYNVMLKGTPIGQPSLQMMSFADDHEFTGPNHPGYTGPQFFQIHDNIAIIDDSDNSVISPSYQNFVLIYQQMIDPPPPFIWNNDVFIGNASGKNERGHFYATGEIPNSGESPSALQTDVLPQNEQIYPDRVAAGISQQFPAPLSAWGCGTVGNMAVP
jgi:hypothetical protein